MQPEPTDSLMLDVADMTALYLVEHWGSEGFVPDLEEKLTAAILAALETYERMRERSAHAPGRN
jgi:hypothetical protein